MNIFITSRHLSNKCGVVNYTNLLMDVLEKEGHEFTHFGIGLIPKYHKDLILPIVYSYQFLKFNFKLKKSNPEIVHLNPSLAWGSIIRDIIFLNIAKAQGYPVLFFMHGWRWQLFKKINNIEFLKKLFRDNLQRADKILVLSKDFKDALVGLGLDEEKIEVTSTMVESEKYDPGEKNFSSPYNVLFCSRMSKAKGPFELIDAIPKVLDEFPKTNFIFMGNGPCLEDSKSKARRMDIEDNVLFTGYKTGDEKIKWYKKSDLFVFPSHTEGFPNVYLEALAAGLPVVATPVGAMKHTLKDGKNGYKLESTPTIPEEIAEKIIKLLRDPVKMKKISQNNLKKAKEKYDVEIICSKIRDIYWMIE